MRREFPGQPVKKWSESPLRSHLTPESTVSKIILSDLKPLVDASAERPGEFAYIVIARVIDRSKVHTIERRDVTPEALAAFLPLRDAAVPVTDRQLADAALDWVRFAVAGALGDREKTKIKVSIWSPKGEIQLVSLRVTVTRAPAPSIVVLAPAPSTSPGRKRVGTFVSSNGPTWRAMIAEAEAGGPPVGDVVRVAAKMAEDAEREGVPQLPLSLETMEAMRRSSATGAAPALPSGAEPSVFSRHGGRFVLAGRASVHRQAAAESELERALYRVVGLGLVGVVEVAVDLSSATVSVVSGVAGAIAGAV